MNKIFTYLELLWHWRMALIPSLYFNLRYLPFKQGVKMPILINKPHLHKMNGKIVIDAAKITTGMIKLGGFGGAYVSKFRNTYHTMGRRNNF